jgi:hypothetical protein
MKKLLILIAALSTGLYAKAQKEQPKIKVTGYLETILVTISINLWITTGPPLSIPITATMK